MQDYHILKSYSELTSEAFLASFSTSASGLTDSASDSPQLGVVTAGGDTVSSVLFFSDSSFGNGCELGGKALMGISLRGLRGPAFSNSICRLCNSSNLATGSQSTWSGTPSAEGRSPAASRSCPQKLGRRIDPGVAGSEGCSISVGKFVSRKLRRDPCELDAASSMLGDDVRDE